MVPCDRVKKCGFCLLIFSFTYWSFITDAIGNSVEETCRGMGRQCLLDYYKDLPLSRRDPVKNDHVTRLLLESGQIREMKTLSIKPPIFEIPNYLSPEECDTIIKIAEKNGLETSSTMDQGSFEDEKYFMEEQNEVFGYYDYNKDGFMDIDEVVNLLDTELDYSPDKEDVIRLFKELKLDRNGDMLVSLKEFKQQNMSDFLKFVAENKREKPYTKSRNSNQTWLETHATSAPILHSLRKRLQKLTQLPTMLLNASESLQVVSYGARGHYNCHMDSDDFNDEQDCCHFDDIDPSVGCRICRYLTVLYFLSDVEDGGETAFPVADNETFDEDVWRMDVERICNLGHNCHKSNIRVKPEKGKAVLWYSHLIDDETGWLGEADPYSFHGGCDVTRGIKWIANNWVSVSENRTKDIEFWIRQRQISSNEKDVLNTAMFHQDDYASDNYLDDDYAKDNNARDDYEEILNTPAEEDETDAVFAAIESSDAANDNDNKDILKAVEEDADTGKQREIDLVFDAIKAFDSRPDASEGLDSSSREHQRNEL